MVNTIGNNELWEIVSREKYKLWHLFEISDREVLRRITTQKVYLDFLTIYQLDLRIQVLDHLKVRADFAFGGICPRRPFVLAAIERAQAEHQKVISELRQATVLGKRLAA